MSKKVVTMGEIMLRLSTPNNERFLQADEVGVQRRHRIQKPLFQAGPQAVYIPGYKFHRSPHSSVLPYDTTFRPLFPPQSPVDIFAPKPYPVS